MKKNIFWIVLFLNLLAIGAFLTYVALRPVEFRAVAPRVGDIAAAKVAADQLGTSRPVSSQAAPPAVAAAGAGGAPPPRKPPKRVEAAEEPSDEGIRIATAKFLGPLSHPLEEQPPPAPLYPFGVERRILPDGPKGRDIEVVIKMRNLSGYYWQQANVVLKSADPAMVPVEFEVNDWAIDGFARFHYRFPQNQTTARMTKLRVRAVYGTKMETTESDRINRERMEILQKLGDEQGAGEKFYEAIGVGDALGTKSGDGASTSTVAEFMLTIPDRKKIADQPLPKLEPSNDERKAIVGQLTQFRDSAVEIEKGVYAFIDLINVEGRSALTSEKGKALLATLHENRAKYDKLGLDLTLAIKRSNEKEVKAVGTYVSKTTNSILELLREANDQIRYIDTAFTFDPQK